MASSMAGAVMEMVLLQGVSCSSRWGNTSSVDVSFEASSEHAGGPLNERPGVAGGQDVVGGPPEACGRVAHEPLRRRIRKVGMSARLVPPVARELRALTELRLEVRAFLAEQVAAGAFVPHVDTWLTRWDRDFTRELGRRGWLGMVIPTEYGGQGRTFLERFVVTEELLVVGAPVAAHWIAERQIGPSLLRYGTEEQKQAFLPGISRGELVFGIGMSEPDSGSDLASVRTRAERIEAGPEGRSGWRLHGTKVWTSGAHEADA